MKRRFADPEIAANETTVKEESASVLNKKCAKCGNTPRMLGLQTTILNACEKCRNLADSIARIQEKEQRRGKPKIHGGTLCRKREHVSTNPV
ncbi:MAG: hypothetical protein HZC04_00760 [Candidatus Lloydbacteria bacterium]|nr:hypothetical protein [Candidatus Lloydbacteria bacterium]